MSQSLTLKIAGLHTSLNELSSVPEGALLKADNIDIIKDHVAQPRRGFERLSAGFSTSTDRMDATFFYQAKQFGHHGTQYTAGELSYFDSGSWTSSGNFTSPAADIRIKFLEANQNLYFTSSTGIQKLDIYTGTPGLSGADKGLDIDATLAGSGSGFLAVSYRVAYRILWGKKDENDNLILGAPTGRTDVKNTSGNTDDIDVATTIPAGVTTDWFYQLYRSSQVDNSSAEVQPNDELQLVFEGNPTAGEITAKTLTISDVVPDSLRGATIYTAATQEGLAFQNERPPMSHDLASFRDVTFFANITSKHRYYLTLTAVGGTNGISATDTLYLGGITYTGASTETIATPNFKVENSGSLSVSQQIKDTMFSLVRVINRHESSTVYAYYLSGPDDLPGKILIEERGIGGAAFSIRSNIATCWNPSDIPTSGDTEQSSNDRFKNGMMWSKPFQPESVPLVNQTQVGSKDSSILRILPLKEALLIFKDEGIYRLTGYYPNFETELLDSSAKLIGQDTPAILNNQIYCLTDQGVVTVSDSVKIISRPIEQDLLELLADDLSLVKKTSFGVSYETDRKYHLFLVGDSGDTTPIESYVFNVFTNAWTKHTVGAGSGIVYENNLYLGDSGSEYVLKDRKNYSYLDYADFGFSTSITVIASNVITLLSNVDNTTVGDIIYQSDSLFATITAIDTINSTVTVDTEPGFTVASCDILTSVATDIQWIPEVLGNAGITKQFHTMELLFKKDFNGTGYFAVESDLSQYEELVTVEGLGNGLWGLFGFGNQPWGGVALKRPVRQWVPRNKQIASQLTVSFRHAWGYSPWELEGITIFANQGSDRTTR